MGGFGQKTREFLGFPTDEDTVEDSFDTEYMFDGDEPGDIVDFPAPEEAGVTTPSTRSFTSKIAPVSTEISRILTVHPSTFDEVEILATAYRQGTPVIANLTELPDDEARRILDFMSGLSFALEGHLERVTNRVFLLSPKTVEIERDAKRAGYGRVFS